MRMLIAAMIAAFGAATVLPAAAIIASDGAFAAEKTRSVKKKPAKKYKKPTKKPLPSTQM